MKRAAIILLVLDILMGLSLFWLWRIPEPVEKDKDETVKTEREVAVEKSVAVDAPAEGTVEVEDDLKKIALTFDDGPHPYYTEQLLDGLKERGVVATFFVTGEHAALHPDIIKRMNEEGHLIGNHTYSHIQLTAGNKEEFQEELVATSEVIEELIDDEVVYVRPPYGCWDKGLETELNMIPVLWTIDPLDWCSDDADEIAGRVLAEADENEIILMHDYYESSVTAALMVVDELIEEGYTFVTVEEILFD